MMKSLKKYLVTGLVVAGPIFLTIYLLYVVFIFVDGILGGFLNEYAKKTLGFYIPGLGVLLFLITIFLIGFIARRLVGTTIFHHLERWFSGMPLIRNIYPAMKQIISFVLEQKEFGFKKVVLVEYPAKGIWSLGFLTNEQFQHVSQASGREMVSVFVPNVPGPLTGNLIFIPKEEMKFVDIPVSEALKIIISGGVFKTNG